MKMRIYYYAAILIVIVCISPIQAELGFTDSFEGPSLDPFWSVSMQNSSYSFSSEQARSGSQSLKVEYESGKYAPFCPEHLFATPVQGTFSVWFYDTLAPVGGLNLDDSISAVAQIGVYGSSYYVYVDPSTTPIFGTRSLGWHHYEITVGDSGSSYRLDGIDLGWTSGLTGANQLILNTYGNYGNNVVAYFDDFSFTPALGITDVTIAPSPAFNIISWKTNNYADGVVEYGPTQTLGFSAIGDSGTGHRVAVPSSPGSLYWKPTSTNSTGQTVQGNVICTVSPGPMLITISNVTATVTSPTSAVISWSTNVPTAGTDKVNLRHLDVVQIPMLSLTSSTSRHNMVFSNLQPNTVYYYKVSSEGAVSSTEYSFTTGSGGIANISAKPTLIGASISWKTGVLTTSVVEYNPAGTDGLNSISTGGLTTNHQLEITKLKSATTYSYRVRSVDAQNNTYVSDWKTFTTPTPLSAGGGGGGSGNCSIPYISTSFSNVRKLPGGSYQVDIQIKNLCDLSLSVKLNSFHLGVVQALSPLQPYSLNLNPKKTEVITAVFPSNSDNVSGRIRILYFRSWNSEWPYNNGFIYDSQLKVTLP